MNTAQLMAANQTIRPAANRTAGGLGYGFSKVAPPLPKFASKARPVSLAPAAKPAGVMDLFRMKSSPPAAQVAPVASEKPALPVGTPCGASELRDGTDTRQGVPATRSPIGAPVRLRSGARLTQSELRLDAVKVVRNDLSETDFEIITPRPAPEEAPAREAAWAGWLARMKGAVRAWI